MSLWVWARRRGRRSLYSATAPVALVVAVMVAALAAPVSLLFP
jgi:hypothetical protein